MSDPLVGFDLSLELSGTGLLNLALHNGSLQFPLAIDFDQPGAPPLHILLQNPTLAFVPPPIGSNGVGFGTVNLTLQGVCGSTNRPDGSAINDFGVILPCWPIAVTVQVGGNDPFDQTPVDPTKAMIYLDFRQARCLPEAVTPSSLSQNDQDTVIDVLQAGITTYLQTMFGDQVIQASTDPNAARGVKRIDPGIVVDPTTQGNLQTESDGSLHLTGLNAAFFANPGSVALLMNVFTSSANNGTPANRTSQLPAGTDVLFSLGNAAFQTFVFCPALAALLSESSTPVPIAMLPSNCGIASSLHNSVSWLIVNANAGAPGMWWLKETIRATHGITWKRFTATLDAGAIFVHVICDVKGPCYEVQPAIDCNLVPAIGSDGMLRFTGTVADIDLAISAPWWCWAIGAALTIDFWAEAMAAILLPLAETIADAIGSALLSAALSTGKPTAGINPPSLPYNMTIDSFNILPGVLQITATLPAPAQAAGTGTLTITQATTSSATSETVSGEFNSTECPVGTYGYTMTFSGQQVVATAIPSGFYCPPLTGAEWLVSTDPGGDTVIIGATSGTFTLSSARISVPDMMLGSVEVTSYVQLDYALSNDGTTITLWNRLATNGTFSVILTVGVTDAHGTNMYAQQAVNFTGPVINVDPSYASDLFACPAGDIEALLEGFNPQTEVGLGSFTPIMFDESQMRRLPKALLLDPSFAMAYRSSHRRTAAPLTPEEAFATARPIQTAKKVAKKTAKKTAKR